MNTILIDRIKKSLEDRNMTKAELSRITGISNSSFYRELQ